MSLVHLRFTILSSPCVHTNTYQLARLPRHLNATAVATMHHTTTWITHRRTRSWPNGVLKRHRLKQRQPPPQHETISADASPHSLTTSSKPPSRSPTIQRSQTALPMVRPGTTKNFMPFHRSSAAGAPARDEMASHHQPNIPPSIQLVSKSHHRTARKYSCGCFCLSQRPQHFPFCSKKANQAYRRPKTSLVEISLHSSAGSVGIVAIVSWMLLRVG